MLSPKALSSVRAILPLLLAGALGTGIRGTSEGAEATATPPRGTAPELLQELKAYPHKIVYETYQKGNWEIFRVNADGSDPVNLTNTPDVDELYPKVSPDGKLICFVADEGKAPQRTRNLYLMKIDGSDRKKFADNAREPCWSADSRSIAHLKGEFGRFELMDFATKGILIYDVASGQVQAHPNAGILHLYCLNWTADKAWFVSTVHGGMGFKHAILALSGNGDKVYDLGLGGCRPDVSPDGKQVAWGHGDWAIGVANLDFSGPTPKATFVHDAVQSADPIKTYHADWSPDGHYIAFSCGDKLEGKTIGGAPEIPGVQAPGWNICVADATQPNRWVVITLDGASNKEPDWAPAVATEQK